jgi:type II secretory pathway pseudopilin PulG
VKSLNCLFRLFSSHRSRGPRRESPDAGYILLIVMMMATLLLVSLAAAAPSIYVEGQREKEQELIFRGEQYARAIILFHQQFKRYPASVKELLHTNNLSFLRQAYPDPMTRSGKWRFIHATANGVVLDSKLLKPPGQSQNKPFGSDNGKSGSQSGSAGTQTSRPATQDGSQQGSFSAGSFSLPGMGQESGQNRQQNSGSSFFSNDKSIGAFIVGVASTSHHQSIGVFDKRTEYDEWEFLGIPGAPGAPNIMGAGAVPVVGAQPGQSPTGLPGSNPNSGGGFHLGPSQPSQPSQPGSIFGGSSNP